MHTLFLLAILPAITNIAVDADDFMPLFNGKDFTGWKAFGRPLKEDATKSIEPSESWTIADGVLKGTGKPTGFLITETEYENYVLKLKWRYPKDLKAGNSGVLLHCQKENKVWPICLEAQLRSGQAGDIWLQTAADVKLTVEDSRRDPNDKTKRHIFRDPEKKEIEKPFGEWNEYEITCKGGSITLAINGKVVNEGKDCSLTKGRIGLQAEGTEIQFKDIAIRKLK